MELILDRIEHNSSIKKGVDEIDSYFDETRELMAEVKMASKMYFPEVLEFVDEIKKEIARLQFMSRAFYVLEHEKEGEDVNISPFDSRHPLNKIISSVDACKDRHQKIINTLCNNET